MRLMSSNFSPSFLRNSDSYCNGAMFAMLHLSIIETQENIIVNPEIKEQHGLENKTRKVKHKNCFQKRSNLRSESSIALGTSG